MILEKVDFGTRRTFAPQVKTPEALPEAPAAERKTGTTPAVIYSKKLKMNLYPYRNPDTGRVIGVITETGERLTETDIEAFRLIDKTFGIETIERLTRAAE
jgi:hypothetical protein